MVRQISLTLSLSAALLAGAAVAQDTQSEAGQARVTNGQSFGDWRVNCEALAVNETTCVLGQRLTRSADNAFITQLLVFWDATGDNVYMSARVPVGVYLPAGFVMKPAADADADEDAQMDFTWQSCSSQLCEALIQLDADARAAMTAGDGLMLAGYRPGLGSEPLTFQFSAAGLGEGLAALDPARDRSE